MGIRSLLQYLRLCYCREAVMHYNMPALTLSMPHVTIVTLSHCVQKVPSLELLRATELSMRLV